MRSVFLMSTAAFLLTGGLALAGGGGMGGNGGNGGMGGGSSDPSGGTTNTTTNTSIPVVKNAVAADSSAAATTGGTAVNANGNETSDSSNTSLDVTKTLVSVGSVALSETTTDTHMNLATSGNSGSVGNIKFSGGGGNEDGWGKSGGALVTSGNAAMNFANNSSTGISTVQQNAGTASLQQNSVALGSYVSGGSTGFNGF